MAGLRSQAERDLAVTLEAPGDFGWPFVLTAPNGFVGASQLHGQAHDIGELVDPETGTLVSGRQITLVARTSSIVADGYPGLPVGIVDDQAKPWLVAFDDLAGVGGVFKVRETKPDRGLGFTALVLEFWKP